MRNEIRNKLIYFFHDEVTADEVLERAVVFSEDFFEQNLPEEFAYLVNHQNILLSPHIGGWSIESYFKLSAVLAEKILAWFINSDSE